MDRMENYDVEVKVVDRMEYYGVELKVMEEGNMASYVYGQV